MKSASAGAAATLIAPLDAHAQFPEIDFQESHIGST